MTRKMSFVGDSIGNAAAVVVAIGGLQPNRDGTRVKIGACTFHTIGISGNLAEEKPTPSVADPSSKSSSRRSTRVSYRWLSCVSYLLRNVGGYFLRC